MSVWWDEIINWLSVARWELVIGDVWTIRAGVTLVKGIVARAANNAEAFTQDTSSGENRETIAIGVTGDADPAMYVLFLLCSPYYIITHFVKC